MGDDREMIVVVVMVSLFGGVVLIMALSCLIRRFRGPRGFSSSYGYDQVNHGLDEEEIEFKNMIESKGIKLDEDDDIFAEDKGDLNFNSKDKDRLNMLETLRSNLVSSVNATKVPNSDDEHSENERIRL